MSAKYNVEQLSEHYPGLSRAVLCFTGIDYARLYKPGSPIQKLHFDFIAVVLAHLAGFILNLGVKLLSSPIDLLHHYLVHLVDFIKVTFDALEEACHHFEVLFQNIGG